MMWSWLVADNGSLNFPGNRINAQTKITVELHCQPKEAASQKRLTIKSFIMPKVTGS